MKPERTAALSRGQQIYLLAGIFITGGVILALEIVGARVISPFYGSSLYCWAAVITVTLVALSAGYHLGGRAADRDPTLALFPKLVAAGAVAVALIPVLREPVLRLTSGLGVRLGAFASAAVLLGPALACLACLGPVVVRLTTQDVSSVGKRSGEAMALSTLGSVLGAVAAAFLLIPHASVSRNLYGMSALLFAVAAAGVLAGRGGLPWKSAAALLLAAAAGWRPSQRPATNVLVSRQSPYGEIKVLDHENRRYLLVNGTSQSIARLPRFETDSPYLRVLELAAGMTRGGLSAVGREPDGHASPPSSTPDEPPRALFIGSGAGLLPRVFEERYGIVSDIVEIDPVMIETARSHFGLRGKGDVYIEDGRTYLERTGRTYDVVVLDAFAGESPPYHLFTREAFESVRRRLRPGGVLCANLVSIVEGEEDDAWVPVFTTMKSVFRETRAFLSSDPYQGLANVAFFASDAPIRPQARAVRALAQEEAAYALSRELKPPPGTVTPLTDDFAPVEALLAETSLRWRRIIQETLEQVLLY